MSKRSDRDRLADMSTYSRHAIDLLGDLDAAALRADLRSQLAVVRAIELVGEAAAQVSEVTRPKLPNLPWKAIVAMRNMLIHGYPDIDLNRVVNVVNDELPDLIAAVEAVLGEDT